MEIIAHRRTIDCMLLCCVLLAPAGAGAQTIRGRVIGSACSEPIAGGRLELRDTAGRLIMTGATSSLGAFVVVAPTRGRYTLRALAIGYRPTPLADIDIGGADTTLDDWRMSRTPRRLPCANASSADPLGTIDNRPMAGGTSHLSDIVGTLHPTLVRDHHFYRLWDQVTDSCIAVVAYSLNYKDLITARRGASRIAPILLALRQYRTRVSPFRDTTLALDLPVPDDQRARPSFGGFFVVPSSVDVTDWTLIVSQPAQRAGADWEDSRPPLSTGPLSLSDLVLGTEEPGLEWNSHGDRVFLTGREPLGATSPMHLYYQVKSEVNRRDVRTEIAIYPADKGAKPPLLHLLFDGDLAKGVNSAQRSLDLSHFEPGSYRVEVLVVDRANGLIAKQIVIVGLQ